MYGICLHTNKTLICLRLYNRFPFLSILLCRQMFDLLLYVACFLFYDYFVEKIVKNLIEIFSKLFNDKNFST